jgi:hypothetical protein
MTLVDSFVHPCLIAATVRRERRDGMGDLVEQRAGSRAIVALAAAHPDRDDFAALTIEADMQFAPRATAGRVMLLNQP